MISPYLLVAGAIVLTGISQVLLKIGSGYAESNRRLAVYLNAPVCLAYVLYILVTVLNTYAMTVLPLKVVYTFGSLNYLIVLFFSGLILKEPVTRKKITAAILISLGVIIFNL